MKKVISAMWTIRPTWCIVVKTRRSMVWMYPDAAMSAAAYHDATETIT